MKLILACTPSGGIGYQNKLPWTKIQGDLPRFKALTDNQVIIMGRNTWDSLPKKPLPNRLNYIISEGLKIHGDNYVSMTFYEFSRLDPKNTPYWLIGGARLIDACWEWVDEIHLTKTFAEYTCDTFISLSYLDENFTQISSEAFEDHEYQVWKRRNEAN